MSPNFSDMKIVFHFHKPSIHNLLISDPIKIPKLHKLKSYTFGWSFFEGLNELREIGPIHLKQNLRLFWIEKDYGWLLLFIFIIIVVVMVFLFFKILLFVLPNGFWWNI